MQLSEEQGTCLQARTLQQLQVTMRALADAAGVRPRLYQYARAQEEVAAEDMVPEWGNLKRGIRLPHHMLRSLTSGPLKRDGGDLLEGIGPRVKASGKYSKPGVSSGRTFTSRFRGVHQTFPTRRWEAQFRRVGKPTSLGCFDREEDAARAYDRMMLWIEMHSSGATKAGITNFDVSQYANDLPWLAGISQDALIDALRTEGRKQASNRGRPISTVAPRTNSTTPEPDSDWMGDDDEDEYEREDGGRKRRRTAQQRPPSQQRPQWQQQQQLDVLQQQGSQNNHIQQHQQGEQQYEQVGSQQQAVQQATGGVVMASGLGLQEAQLPDATALEALRATQEAMAAAVLAARQAHEDEQRHLLLSSQGGAQQQQQQQQQQQVHMVHRATVRGPPSTRQA